jgi:hypothetical protein
LPLCDARKRSGIAPFFGLARMDIIRSQTPGVLYLVSTNSGRDSPSVRPPNSGAGSPQREWHNPEAVPSPHSRLSLPRQEFLRAWNNPTLMVTSRGMPWKTAPGALQANRKFGVKQVDASVEVSDRSVGHRIERLEPRSRFSARGPGWPTCPQGAEDLGSVCYCPRKPASIRWIGESCPTSKGLLS